MSRLNLMWLQHQFYNKLMGGVFPIRWFAPLAPRAEALTVANGRLHIQIVSHCWNYAHMLHFQLSSLANYPPTEVDITYTLYHAAEDVGVKAAIERFDQLQIPNVTWQWVELPKNQLFRRAIGRHQAAKSSTADWIWFSDCDLIFHEHCLDSLAQSLQSKRAGLVHPDSEHITDLLDAEHPLLNQHAKHLADIDKNLFSQHRIDKAKGAFQIVHGDVARTAGYCGSIKLYQTPTDTWRKTYEDAIFRKLIQYSGEPVPIKGLYRIRHAEKGRYSSSSSFDRLRRWVRRTFDIGGNKNN